MAEVSIQAVTKRFGEVEVIHGVDCHIADLRLMALWRELRSRLDLLPPRATRITLRLDREGRRHIIVESTGEPWQAAPLRAELSDPDKVVCWWHPVDGAETVQRAEHRAVVHRAEQSGPDTEDEKDGKPGDIGRGERASARRRVVLALWRGDRSSIPFHRCGNITAFSRETR